jgi:hypothetical protein
MIDGWLWTKGSLGSSMLCSRLVPARCSPTGERSKTSPTRGAQSNPGMIQSSAATISERSLPDALGLKVFKMVVKHVDRPIKGFDDKSTLQPSKADWTPRRGGYDFKEAKRLLADRVGLMLEELLSGKKGIALAFRRQCISLRTNK